MNPSQPSQRGQGPSSGLEGKGRGAKRSTKVAGKLKVLPDQPEPIVPVDKVEPPPPARRDEGESSATVEDSEDDEGEEAEAEDTEDLEVSCPRCAPAFALICRAFE